MANKYDVMRAKERNRLADVDLILRPHKGSDVVMAQFGPGSYSGNTQAMAKHYWNSQENPDVTFRPATTSESVSAVAYDFANIAKPSIFNPRWLQTGRIARWDEGVFLNILSAIREGNLDENILRQLRDKSKTSGRGDKAIRLGKNGFAYVPYESFKQGKQDAKEFAESGLARGLEHVDGSIAPNLNSMASTYRDADGNSVNVVYFDKSETPVSRVVDLYSYVGLLHVDGDDWYDYYDGCGGDCGGYAFGVRDSARSADAKK